MQLLVQDILKDSMYLCGALGVGEIPTTDEYTLLLRTANVMIDRWSSQRLLLRSTHPISFAMTIDKRTYTIGLAGSPTPDIVANKPMRIVSATVKDTGELYNNVEIIDDATYNNLGDQDIIQGQPIYMTYSAGDAQQTYQTGTINVYPAPDRTFTMYMEVDAYLTEFVNLTDVVTFEPAYYEALIYNLAVRTFRFFRDASVPVPQEITAIAATSLSNLRAINSVQVLAGMEFPGKLAKWDIYSDSTV